MPTSIKNIPRTKIYFMDFVPLGLQRMRQALKKRGARPLQKKKRTLQFIPGINLFDFFSFLDESSTLSQGSLGL